MVPLYRYVSPQELKMPAEVKEFVASRGIPQVVQG